MNPENNSISYKRLLQYGKWLKEQADQLWESDAGSTRWLAAYHEQSAVDSILNTMTYGKDVFPLPNEK